MKKIIVSLFVSGLFFSASLGATPEPLLHLLVKEKHAKCPQAVPSATEGFCASFKSVASCHCTSAGLPAGMCQDVNVIYNRMISMFGSIKRACDYQKDTTAQICMDAWACYRQGGKNSQGGLCSTTGNACA